jgi:hypothetical protein
MAIVYKAENIYKELSKRWYYESAFFKVKLLSNDADDLKFSFAYKELKDGSYYIKPNIWNGLCYPEYKCPIPHKTWKGKELIHVGDEYIMSFYKMHHQQVMPI